MNEHVRVACAIDRLRVLLSRNSPLYDRHKITLVANLGHALWLTNIAFKTGRLDESPDCGYINLACRTGLGKSRVIRSKTISDNGTRGDYARLRDRRLILTNFSFTHSPLRSTVGSIFTRESLAKAPLVPIQLGASRVKLSLLHEMILPEVPSTPRVGLRNLQI